MEFIVTKACLVLVCGKKLSFIIQRSLSIVKFWDTFQKEGCTIEWQVQIQFVDLMILFTHIFCIITLVTTSIQEGNSFKCSSKLRDVSVFVFNCKPSSFQLKSESSTQSSMACWRHWWLFACGSSSRRQIPVFLSGRWTNLSSEQIQVSSVDQEAEARVLTNNEL